MAYRQCMLAMELKILKGKNLTNRLLGIKSVNIYPPSINCAILYVASMYHGGIVCIMCVVYVCVHVVLHILCMCVAYAMHHVCECCMCIVLCVYGRCVAVLPIRIKVF